jgi:hypothetical protein
MLGIKAAQAPVRKPIMKKALLIVPFAILAMAVGAFADTIQLQEVADPTTIVKVSFLYNGATYTGRVYAGFYVVDVQGLGEFNAFCVDPADVPTDPQEYSLVPIANLNDPTLNYRKAAWLLQQYEGSTGQTAAYVQLTVWKLMFPEFDVPYGYVSPDGHSYSDYLSKVPIPGNSDVANFDSSGYFLAVSPIPVDPSLPYDPSLSYDKGTQDYIIHVPEPGIVTLLGIALGAIGLFWKKIGV